MKVKELMFLAILLFILWKLYFFLSGYFQSHWLVPTLFVFFIILGRVCLFIYRYSKGVKDTYLDD